jgi:hypothetical protein
VDGAGIDLVSPKILRRNGPGPMQTTAHRLEKGSQVAPVMAHPDSAAASREPGLDMNR